MTIREYLHEMLPTLAPGRRKSTLQAYARGVEALYRWLGREIELADMSPHLIERFRAVDSLAAGSVRAIMATHDPVRFRMRSQASARRFAKSKKPGPCSEAEIYLSNVYEQRYEPLALRSRRPSTKQLYRTTLAAFDRFLKRAATLGDLNDETVSRFATWRLASGLSKYSVNKDLFNLLALWRWCHRKGLVEAWPDVELEKPPRRQPMAWTKAEIQKLYRTAASLPGKVGKLRACDWWAALLLLAWDSGERIGAIINLEWGNVDLERGWVRFTAEDRKGARDDSAVRISSDTVEALRRIRAKDGPVFPWPYCYTYRWNELGRILRLAGLPADAKSKFHRIRKTVASYAEAAGGNATAMLRHSKREITESYLDPRICQRQQPADVLFRLA